MYVETARDLSHEEFNKCRQNRRAQVLKKLSNEDYYLFSDND